MNYSNTVFLFLLKPVLIAAFMLTMVACVDKPRPNQDVEVVMALIEQADSNEIIPGSDDEIKMWKKALSSAKERLPEESWPVARAKFGLSRSLQNAYQIKEALEYSQSAKASLKKIQAQPLSAPGRKYYSLEQHVVHILANAVLLSSDNQFSEARDSLSTLRVVVNENDSNNELLLAKISYGEAQILSDTGDFIDSVEIMEKIYPTLVKHLGHLEALHMQAYEGFLNVQGEGRLITPLSLNHAGLMADLQGKEDLALSRLAQSVALMDKLGTPRHSAITSGKNNYIQALFGKKDFKVAKKIALDQKNIADILYPKHHYLNIGQDMILKFASIKAGDQIEYSSDIYDKFKESVEKFTLLIDEESEAFNAGYLAEQGLALAIINQNVEAAIKMADLILKSDLVKYTNVSAQRALAESDTLKGLIRNRQDLEKELRDTDSEILKKHSLGESYLELDRKFKEIEKRLNKLDQTISINFPDWYESIKTNDITLDKLQQQLSSKEALIIPIHTRRFMHVIAVTQDSASVESVAHNGGKTAEDIMTLLDAASRPQENRFPNEISQSLYRKVFPQKIEDLIKFKSQWNILPSGPLMSLNPALLQSSNDFSEKPSWLVSSKAILIRTSLLTGLAFRNE